MRKRTIVFLAFMGLFFVLAGYLTYYSGVVYLRNLPEVKMQMPKQADQYEYGRMTYYISKDAIHKDPSTGNYYILVARYTQDVLGERYLAVRLNVWLLEETEENKVRVDGIVWEEPILLDAEEVIKDGDAIKYQKQ